MTRLLTKAFKEAGRLPAEAQNQLAAQLLEDLASEAKWDETLASSPDVLEKLADEALEEYREGRTEELGFDEL